MDLRLLFKLHGANSSSAASIYPRKSRLGIVLPVLAMHLLASRGVSCSRKHAVFEAAARFAHLGFVVAAASNLMGEKVEYVGPDLIEWVKKLLPHYISGKFKKIKQIIHKISQKVSRINGRWCLDLIIFVSVLLGSLHRNTLASIKYSDQVGNLASYILQPSFELLINVTVFWLHRHNI